MFIAYIYVSVCVYVYISAQMTRGLELSDLIGCELSDMSVEKGTQGLCKEQFLTVELSLAHYTFFM